jgi:hypothetical protein
VRNNKQFNTAGHRVTFVAWHLGERHEIRQGKMKGTRSPKYLLVDNRDCWIILNGGRGWKVSNKDMK